MYDYYGMPKWFLREYVDFRDFVASTQKRRKKKPSCKQKKRKK